MCENSKKTLSDEELAVRAANGDDASMALLIAIVTPIAKAKASGFANARISGEDLVQEGMLGFLDAVKTFDISKGASFKAYAEACINNRIISAVRVNFNNKNAALSNAVSYETEAAERSDTSTDPVEIITEKDETEYLAGLLDKGLSGFEKQVVDLRLQDKSYSQIAAMLGCSEKAVDNALQRIRKKMRLKLS
ncbi:MAG: sigma-70 family RNA polymerase sigma factor [Clostridia bacterium]|nr:sigma-70 family RNA polymerase sigma factor [Clostridia bacterium]MBQ7121103.1 sigma-70 family RNA polymerase sigma factor [Clostridia bacterium]